MKKILVIKVHPKENSFCNALADKYIEGATKSNNEIKILNLKDLNLEKFIKYEHAENPKLSTDLLESQKLITWSNHLVFVYPTWWATPPALLKVFFEIVFHSEFAYKYKKSTGIAPKWDKLLLNKSARVVVTMDSPPWYYKWFAGDPGFKMMKDIMNFCGIKPVHKNYFGSVKMSSESQRKNWLEKIYKIGLNE
jgi:putative NADPH-quinone reductase